MHALYRILNSPVRPWPHRHLFIENVFPADFYAALQRCMPSANAYTSLAKTGKVAEGDYDMRSGFLLNEEHLGRVPADIARFWTGLFDEVLNDEFADALMARHGDDLRERLEREGKPLAKAPHRDMILVRDRSSDGVKIHTSDPGNLLTLLFYLPADARHADCGTTLYLPKERERRCWGGPHHEFEGFDPVWTMPYVPNSLFMFVKTDDSFHGVKPIHVENLRRDLMLFYVKR
ncbi:hypothetical protein [Azospirillum sp. SYSU D00513]|uniref:hypothetical protein n=1 Tax=Azospirillum sp. SYSU D00513 TaxID=2812561 RepID=UPI001A960C07|nr:hypothetical protein [Azospirillum sp. SYSU D00513]